MITICRYGALISTDRFSIRRFQKCNKVNRAKKLRYPTIRGTLLPCWDWQYGGGIAINWLWIRVRISNP